jgi:hypothetical protein
MSLLQDIQDAAIEADVAVSVVLRKCRVLATRLKNAQFAAWVEQELNGYDSELPPYRTFHIDSYGYFVGFGGQILKNAPIPLGCFPDDVAKLLATYNAGASISTYESFIREGHRDGIRAPWPPNSVVLAADKIYQNMRCLEAWQFVPNAVFATLLDTVRNKALSFALEIEAQAPNAGERVGEKSAISAESVNRVFNTYILGNVRNFSGSAEVVVQNSTISVTTGDFATLAAHLKSNGVTDADLEALHSAIKQDPKPTGSFGERVNAWIGRMLGKAAQGTWKVSLNVAAHLLTGALTQYYNLKH